MLDVLIKNCVWSVNTGFDPARTQWTADNSVENGDIAPGGGQQAALMVLAGQFGERAARAIETALRRPRAPARISGLHCDLATVLAA